MSPASCRAPQREQGQTWRVSFLRSSDAAGGCIGCQMRQLREEAETAVAVARDRGIALAFPEMDQDRGGLPTAPLGTHCVSAARSHANFELGPVLGHHEVAADAPRGDAEEVSCSLSVVVSRTWPSRRTRRCVQRRRAGAGFLRPGGSLPEPSAQEFDRQLVSVEAPKTQSPCLRPCLSPIPSRPKSGLFGVQRRLASRAVLWRKTQLASPAHA